MCVHILYIPADLEVFVILCGIGSRTRFEVAGVEVGQRVVGVAVHGTRLTVNVLVHHPWDKL